MATQAFFVKLTQMMRAALADQTPPPPEVLRNLDAQLNTLEQLAGEIETDWGTLAAWIDAFNQISQLPNAPDSLLIRMLQQASPRLAGVLTLLGLIDYHFEGTTLQSFSLDWTQLNALITNPGAFVNDLAQDVWFDNLQSLNDVQLMQVYISLLIFGPEVLLALEYQKAGFTALPSPNPLPADSPQQKLLGKLVNSPVQFHLPSPIFADLETLLNDPTIKPAPGADLLEIDAQSPTFPDDLKLTLFLNNVGEMVKKQVDLGNGWVVTFSSPENAPGGKTFALHYKNNQWDKAILPDNLFAVTVAKTTTAGNPALLIGERDGTHFEVGELGLSLKLNRPPTPNDPLFTLGFILRQVALVLKPTFLDFLSGIFPIPDTLRFDADINTDFVQGSGLRNQGNSGEPNALGFNFVKALNLQLGGAGANLTIERINVRIEARLSAMVELSAQLRFSASAQLGPVNALMDGAGIQIGRWQENGVTQFLAPLAPNGIGINIEAGPIAGGGFLKLEGQRFSGALSLKLLAIDIFAFGIYEKTPQGNVSFVAVIGIRFPLGIQLSFGFMLTGVGGLVGINRTANIDVLAERLASGASGNVLFCDDPVKNAPTLLGDLGQFFPVAEGKFIIGPTLQINWLYLFRLDLGLFIELPGPSKIIIAGSARAIIGFSEDVALIRLRMDVLGVIDFARKLISFDAALVNSTVLGVLSITGGVAFRLSYGDQPYFLLSVGGFHPAFHPEPIVVPHLDRVGASLSLNVVAKIWLRNEMYVAFTSNTFQLGSRTEAGIEIGPLSAQGFFQFNALIQFKPFHFEADISAGFDIEFSGVSFASIYMEGTLSGPGPLVIHARASVKLLFVRVSASATITLGDNNGDSVAPIPSVVQAMIPELENFANLRAEGEDRTVLLKQERAKVTGVLLSPVGSLIWEQKRAPLGVALQRFDGAPLNGLHTLALTSSLGGTPEDDWFSPGVFINLSESEGLNNAALQQLRSGLRMSATTLDTSVAVEKIVEMKLVKLPERPLFAKFTMGLYLNGGLLSALRERGITPAVNAGKVAVSVTTEKWQVIDPAGTVVTQTQPPIQAFQMARQTGVAVAATQAAIDLTGV